MSCWSDYQFTGGYTDGNTGLVHLDARWYNPHTRRFVQPDYWNLKNTYLPAEIQHELMRFTGLNASQLLRDPNQQLAYGYVSGNPLTWVDPFGLNYQIVDVDDFELEVLKRGKIASIEKSSAYNGGSKLGMSKATITEISLVSRDRIVTHRQLEGIDSNVAGLVIDTSSNVLKTFAPSTITQVAIDGGVNAVKELNSVKWETEITTVEVYKSTIETIHYDYDSIPHIILVALWKPMYVTDM